MKNSNTLEKGKETSFIKDNIIPNKLLKLEDAINENSKIKKSLIPKKWKLSRYIIFFKYNNFRKNINLLIGILSWKFNLKKIYSKPAFLRVEISRKCNVDCPYCFMKKDDLFYPFDLFKNLVSNLKKYLYVISLYEIGEPLENNDIIQYIRFAKENNVGTIISSHLSIERDDKFWKDFVTSGLDNLIVAIDGISEKTYNKYRRQGDFDLVINNLHKILSYKKKFNSKIRIEWQFIDFEWNKHEQKGAKEYAYNIGCDDFRVIREAVKPRLKYKKDKKFIRSKNCVLPYYTFNVTAYNKVRPCTKIYNFDMEIGDLNKENFNEIWNGKEIQKIRSKKLIKCREGCRTCKE